MFSWPMITGVFDGGVLYSFTSVPQMPATSIFMSALSSGMSGIGNSRISVRPGATRTAANTFSTLDLSSRASRLALDGGLRHALARLERLARAFLERRSRRQHDRHRAHFLVHRVAPGRERSLGGELLRGLHQPVARHDHAVIGGDE